MTDKAYIVANEQQERELLENLEREGCEWLRSSKNPTDFIPSHDEYTIQLPYILLVDYDQISWCDIKMLSKFDIVFDGRKEEQMSDKYVVSQEFMDELEEWKEKSVIEELFVTDTDLDDLPKVVKRWWISSDFSSVIINNRLIAIIRWMNGEDVFEVEKPKKWVVRSKEVNDDGDKHYWKLLNLRGVLEVTSTFELRLATKFDTKEEAESWANAHQEVIKVEVEA